MQLGTGLADEMFGEATKLVTPSFLAFRFSADWQQATPLFEQAAQKYRLAKAHEQSLAAYRQVRAPGPCAGGGHHL